MTRKRGCGRSSMIGSHGATLDVQFLRLDDGDGFVEGVEVLVPPIGLGQGDHGAGTTANGSIFYDKEPTTACTGGAVVSYERAAKLCSRCAKRWRFGFSWPEGYVCRSCATRALKMRGRCPGCSDERLLVGRDGEDRPICVDCAGITTWFACSTCGQEGQQWYTRTCLSCSLARRLGALLDDGTGQVAPALVPLFEKITSMANPI